MTNLRLKFDYEAIGELALRSQAVTDMVAQATDRIASTLAAEVGEDNVEQVVAGKSRARGYVRRTGPTAMQDEARDGALSRALRSGGVS